MSDHESVQVLRTSLEQLWTIVIVVLGLQSVSLAISLGKLWMMSAVRHDLRAAQKENEQSRWLLEQYQDLYERSVHAVRRDVVGAVQDLKDTVTSGPVVVPDDKARERHERYEVKHDAPG